MSAGGAVSSQVGHGSSGDSRATRRAVCGSCEEEVNGRRERDLQDAPACRRASVFDDEMLFRSGPVSDARPRPRLAGIRLAERGVQPSPTDGTAPSQHKSSPPGGPCALPVPLAFNSLGPIPLAAVAQARPRGKGVGKSAHSPFACSFVAIQFRCRP